MVMYANVYCCECPVQHACIHIMHVGSQFRYRNRYGSTVYIQCYMANDLYYTVGVNISMHVRTQEHAG